MSQPIYISSFGAVTNRGIHSPKGFVAWPDGVQTAGAVERCHVLSKPYIAFGKLTPGDKLAFAASALALENSTHWQGDHAGICIDMPYGSLSTDLRYQETINNNFPSPAIFSSTLPSSAVADIAIYYKIKGPNRVVAEGRTAGIAALELAISMIDKKKVSACLAIALVSVENSDRQLPAIDQTTIEPDYAVALLLSTTPGAMRLTITDAPPSSAINGNTTPYMVEVVKALEQKVSATIPVFFNNHGKSIILSHTT